jgi:soluble lytic murein transglycosylase
LNLRFVIFGGEALQVKLLEPWIARYGDPRDPTVDPVDWVERIPFMETRNYVQRVMENFQVYRVRFANDAPLTIDKDLRRDAAAR